MDQLTNIGTPPAQLLAWLKIFFALFMHLLFLIQGTFIFAPLSFCSAAFPHWRTKSQNYSKQIHCHMEVKWQPWNDNTVLEMSISTVHEVQKAGISA